MAQYLKRIFVVLCAGALLLGGCSNKQDEETTKEEKIEITENAVYLVPDEPTSYMKTAYDEVSDALRQSDAEAEAQAVAKLFVADFFTLSNKDSDTDIGGLNYVPSETYEDMETYARFYFYNNYSSIVAELGKEELPTVKEVTVKETTPAQITYGNTNYDGYQVSVDIAYDDTKASDLKTSATLSIIKMDDYDYDTLVSINNGELSETPAPKTLMRIIALE